MKLSEYIGSQFGNPRGIVGKLCCLLMNIINKLMYIGVVDAVDIDCNSTALDIGFGNGYLIQQLSKKLHSTIYGIDISKDMLAIASSRNSEAIKAGKVILSIGDCCSLSFENEKLDAITSVNTIYFWHDTLMGLSEINRVLKNGGSFYNAVYSKEWLEKLSYTKSGFKLFEKKDYIRLGKEANFKDVIIKEIVSGKSYLVEFKK